MSARSFLRRVLAGVALSVLAITLAVPPASAHDVLIASDPQEGQTLSQSPQTITLTFNNAPLDVGSAIVVADADGVTVAEGEGTVEGTDVFLELPADLPSGSYQASWRVASSDGHPIDGVIAFAVDLVAEPTAEAAPAQVPTADPQPTAEPTPAAAAEQPTEQDTEASTGGLSGLPLWLRVAIGLAALAAVIGLIVRVVQRRNDDGV